MANEFAITYPLFFALEHQGQSRMTICTAPAGKIKCAALFTERFRLDRTLADKAKPPLIRSVNDGEALKVFLDFCERAEIRGVIFDPKSGGLGNQYTVPEIRAMIEAQS